MLSMEAIWMHHPFYWRGLEGCRRVVWFDWTYHRLKIILFFLARYICVCVCVCVCLSVCLCAHAHIYYRGNICGMHCAWPYDHILLLMMHQHLQAIVVEGNNCSDLTLVASRVYTVRTMSSLLPLHKLCHFFIPFMFQSAILRQPYREFSSTQGDNIIINFVMLKLFMPQGHHVICNSAVIYTLGC